MAKRKKRRRKSSQSKVRQKDPCSCGTKLKDENCCTERTRQVEVNPTNNPEVIDYHLTSSDGGKTWEKKPGNLCAVVCGVKSEDMDKRTYDLIGEALKKTDDLNNKKLKKKLFDCRHKLQAVRYHLSSISSEIEERVKEYRNNYNAGSGVSLEMENPRLVYETEAFLFQVKSSLDLLTQAVGCTVAPLESMHTFSKKDKLAGGKVISALTNNGFEKLGNLFEEHRIEWIQKLVEMRDTITHYSELKGFHCFIEDPYVGGGTVSIHSPTMPTGERVEVYCQNVYDKLLELYKSTLHIAIKQEQ